LTLIIHEIYRLNETAKPHQQPPVEEQLTKRDSSNFQAATSQAQSLDEVMKPVPPIPSLKKEKPQLVPACNQGKFFVELKKIKQSVALEEVSIALKFSRRSTNYTSSAKELGSTRLKYCHLWKIIIIIVRLFFMISKIHSYGKRVPMMTVLDSSSLYHLLSTRECNMLCMECQNPSSLVL